MSLTLAWLSTDLLWASPASAHDGAHDDDSQTDDSQTETPDDADGDDDAPAGDDDDAGDDDAGDDGADDDGAGDDAGDDSAGDGTDATDDEATEADEDPVESYGSTKHMQVLAKSLRLKRSAGERLNRIAERFHAATGRQLVITGGDRSALRQAELMHLKLDNGEDLLKIYARDDLVREIVAAYKAAKAKGPSKKREIAAMETAIAEQIARDQFVSRHLDFTAADVRCRDLKPDHLSALRSAVKAEPGARYVDESNSVSPHIHLNLLP